uniref:GRF-type domain-containing protein n=1 Tax=Lactuca sativa TaxID=4236 RepID=A0A9R1XMB4_LACSA|nr:hypothetical protein LSAT_V11C300122560 [Lactuca sativa]
MTTSSSRSSFNGGTRMRNKKVIRCNCGDVCGVSVSRTPDNPGRKFWGCPNYQEATVVFFKWADEELGDQAIVISDHRVVSGYIADARNSGY